MAGTHWQVSLDIAKYVCKVTLTYTCIDFVNIVAQGYAADDRIDGWNQEGNNKPMSPALIYDIHSSH